MAIKNYLGSFVLKNLKISHESGVVLIISPNNVTMIKQRKYETIVNSQTGLEWYIASASLLSGDQSVD